MYVGRMLKVEPRAEVVFAFALAGLVIIGLINLYSAAHDQTVFFKRQLLWTFLGAAAGLFLAATDYRIFRNYSTPLYIIGVLVLALTAVAGREVKSTRSWLGFGGFSIQPSELFKAIFIVHMAAFIGKIRREHKDTMLRGLVLPLVFVGLPTAMVLWQGDTGTAGVYPLIFFVIFYMADMRVSFLMTSLIIAVLAAATVLIRVFVHLEQPAFDPVLQAAIDPKTLTAAFLVAIAVLLPALWVRLRMTHFRGGAALRVILMAITILYLGVAAGSAAHKILKPHQQQRIAAIFDPQRDPHGSGYQTIQSVIAVGSGGWFGKGYGNGTQTKLGFLPEQWTDFIFSVLAEEWGFAGCAVTILLYGLLIGGAIRIATRATDLYGCLLATGTAAVYLVHVGVGIAMSIGIFPVIGIPLSFLSYGGSSQLLNLCLGGMVLSVAHHRRYLAA